MINFSKTAAIDIQCDTVLGCVCVGARACVCEVY